MSTTAEMPPGWRRPAPSPRALRSDILLAAAITVGMIVSMLLYRRADIFGAGPFWLSALWALASGGLLAVRRRFPEVVAVAYAVGFGLAIGFEFGDPLFANIGLFIAYYTLGAWGADRRVATTLRILIVGGMFVWLFWILTVSTGFSSFLPDRDGLPSKYVSIALINILMNALYFGGAWIFGDAAYRAARQRAELEERTRELADERETTRAQAVRLERVRIARELHDVVAHHVSVMGVQAGAARRLLGSDPERAAESLQHVEGSARTAVKELSLLVGTLRDDGSEADGASTLGLGRLPELVAETEAAGTPTALRVVGEPRPLPATVELTVYRIAQEALTNTRKHAGPGASAELRLRYLAGGLELEASDTGLGAARLRGSTRGYGQRGMRERAESVGGRVELGPRPRGGYLVRAWFPLGEESG